MAKNNFHKKKQPKFGKLVSEEKRVRRNVDPAFHENLSVAWKFSTVDRGGAFAWKVPPKEIVMVLEKLSGFETMPRRQWLEQGSHEIQTHKLSKEAQQRLAEIKQDDVDGIWSLRINGTCRVCCIQEGHVMRVLWYDPDHKVCPSELKHT